MNNLRIKLSVIAAVLLLASCNDYLDINENPNKPSEVPMSLLMANASYRTGDNIQAVGNITSYYVQYLASPNAFGSKDVQDATAFDETWQNLYRMMSDISDILILADEQNSPHYKGTAQVLMAINLGMTTDIWGDLPYTEAFTGEYLKPIYDDDQSLYGTITSLLDDAIANLGSGTSELSPGSDDFIYGGDLNKWIRLAYSLKARYLLHASNTGDATPGDILAAVDKGILLNADDGKIVYSDQGFDVYNPWAKVAIDQESAILDGWISEQLADAMNGTSYNLVDPRLPFMFSATDDGEYIGVPNGEGRGTGVDISGDRSVLSRDTYYAANTAPILIITAAETRFIEAEAALASGNKPRAYDAYLAGIQAHMRALGVKDADISTYVNDATVSVGADNLTLDLIMKEKYVALFLSPETWNDARRFDYKYKDMTLPANHNPDLNGNYIRRLIYPDSETSRNGANVPSVTLLDRIWWDE
jgi:hypothetical protein